MLRIENLHEQASVAYQQIVEAVRDPSRLPGWDAYPLMYKHENAVTAMLAQVSARPALLVADFIDEAQIYSSLLSENGEVQRERSPAKRLVEHGDVLYFTYLRLLMHYDRLDPDEQDETVSFLERSTSAILSTDPKTTRMTNNPELVMFKYVFPKVERHYPRDGFGIAPHERTMDMPAVAQGVLAAYKTLRDILILHDPYSGSDLSGLIATYSYMMTDDQQRAAQYLGLVR